jgi:hypothetical protein
MAGNAPPKEVVSQLAALFRRNGYVRWPNRDRRIAEKAAYRKGYEVRLVADSPTELKAIRRLLKAAGFAAANPFPKARRWRQPVYGKEAVARFLKLVGWEPEEEQQPGTAGTRATTPPGTTP